MNSYPETMYQQSLQVFGKVTASLSHEIKNALAIINENAGLLEDITCMIDEGAPIDTDRLKRLASTLSKQIERIDELIKHMNRFSHSMDEWIKEIELYDLVSLMIVLTQRLASMKRITFTVDKPSTPILMTTHIMFLEALLFLCINETLTEAKSGDRIPIKIIKNDDGATILFQTIETTPERIEYFISQHAGDFLNILKGSVKFDVNTKEFSIHLPNKIVFVNQ